MNQTPTTPKLYFIVILAMIAFAYLVYRLVGFDNWESVMGVVAHQPKLFITLIVIQLVLLAMNLLLETLKWHHLIKSIHNQPFRISLLQTLGGSAVGAFTPARMGEPAGRLLHIPEGKRLKAIALGFLGGMIQTAVIVVFGIIALSQGYFISLTDISIDAWPGMIGSLFFAILLACCIWLWVRVFKPELLRKLVSKGKKSLSLVRGKRLLMVSVYTLLRYICFSAQLLLWFKYFSPNSGILLMLAPVAFYYLIVTAIPAFFLADLGIRGSVAVFVFSSMGINIGVIVSVIFCQWIITSCIPAITGVIVYLRMTGKTVLVKK